jgi:ABC-type branched-subunit amino acid transport system permease subunit
LVLRSPTYLHILVLLFFYAYLTTSWNLVGGFAGVLPLGHSMFVGIGAYTSTMLSLQYVAQPLDRYADRRLPGHGGRGADRAPHLQDAGGLFRIGHHSLCRGIQGYGGEH